MGQLEDLQGSIEELRTSAAAAETRVTNDLNSLGGQITDLTQHIHDLEAQIAAGTPPDLGPIKEAVDSIRATVEGIDPAVAPPPQPPPGDPAGGPPAEPPPA